MTKAEIVSLIIQTIIAFGTISAVIVAIWGDLLRSKFAPAKLTIEEHNFRGSTTKFSNGKNALFFHMIVRNRRSWIASRNCRAMLVQIQKKGLDGEFHQQNLVIPLQFSWSPAEVSPLLATINKEQVLDLGFIAEGDECFRPALYYVSNNFQGFIKKGELFRYFIEIYSDNFTSSKPFVVEISWDGKWSDDLDIMSQHLLIKVIK